MDEFIKQSLEDIERLSELIKCDIRGIIGYCAGMATAAARYASEQAETKNAEILELKK